MELTADVTACGESCCGAAPRRTVGELFSRGFRRNRAEPFPLQGASISADGLSARFSLRVTDGVIAEVRFKASSCATLIAYCELIAELAPGSVAAETAAINAPALIAALPDAHPMKRDRAVLAVGAFRAALALTLSHSSPSEDVA